MKKQMNKNNWSGDEGSYEVKGNRVIMDNGDMYDMYGYEDENGKHITVRSQQHNDTKIWDIYSFKEGEYMASDMGVKREGKTPAEVVAQMHWSLC